MKKLTLILGLFAAMIGCQSDDETTVTQGSVQFEILDRSSSNSGGREQADEPSSIVLSINDASGQTVIDNQEFNITPFGNSFLVDPILLDIGNYELTQFLVLDDTGAVILATPLQGSVLASLVDNPLPVAFTISSDQVTDLDVEVISTENVDPEDLGYTSIAFNTVPTIDILVSTFAINEDRVNFDFVASTLTVYGDGDSLFSQPLGDTINVVKLRVDIAEYTFVASADFGTADPVIVSQNELATYVETPLDIIIPRNLFSNGLYTLINDNLVQLDVNTGAVLETTQITNFTNDERHSGMTYSSADQAFYLVQNNTNNPELAKIDADGNYSVIGNITLNGSQIALAEALAFDEATGTMYLMASLNGGTANGDFWSESLMTINTETAETSFVTEIITNVSSQPEADADDFTIEDGVFYFIDNAPPGANFTTIYNISATDLLVNGNSSPNVLLTRSHIPAGRIAIAGDELYLTSERSLYDLDINNPSALSFVGDTHSASDFDGEAIVSVAFVD